MMRTNLVALLCICAIGCNPERPAHETQDQTLRLVPETQQDKSFRTQLLAIAQDYRSYGRAEWRISRSEDENTHGAKIYTMYVDNLPRTSTEQVFVMESWDYRPDDPSH